MSNLTGNLRTFEGPQLSTLMAGRVIAEVYKTNELLVIRCQDGSEIRVAWVTGNGTPVKGEPAIAFFGKHVFSPGAGKILRQTGRNTPRIP